ncbi:uncharacterized protein LOC101214565 [Cucumis sativus]|uniref:uncharacterized protein LOC101214565 n=1 Tax=Cucumis sativus TaxID=3659 RepID=UPI0012F4C663|nr:uncharacterized protein LOC101214565 [Cucumis sativus]KAE8647850.1 hypothetical protein Csa_000137 [Cucumis sativus]
MSLITSPQAVNFGGSQSFRRFSSYTFLNKRTSCIFQQKKNYGNYNKRKTNNTLVLSCLMDDSFSCPGSSSNSPGEMIERFYKCINEKNLKEMSTYISEDCLIEDSLFIEKFKGKKAAMSFIEKLTESMGPDVKFRIRKVYERHPSMAGAIWHLEWRNMEIPLTKGCTFIDIRDEERKTIQKIQIINEPQFKAGHLILDIMKLVTLLLAKNSAILEWLIKASQQRWVKWMSKICVTLFNLLLDSFSKSYLTFIHFGAQLYSCVLKFLYYIVDFFL